MIKRDYFNKGILKIKLKIKNLKEMNRKILLWLKIK